MHPRIIMHPYRKDLERQGRLGLPRPARRPRSSWSSPTSCAASSEGYIEYVWQWKDDPQRLVPKESYIRGFEPWGWIIGTGIYIEDVKQEIARIERNLVRASAGHLRRSWRCCFCYVMQQSLRLERERSEAEESLRESTERYRSLVEATTEGTLLVLDGRCRYANPILLEMLG